MTAQRVGWPWLTLRQIIGLFVAMGCEPQEFPGEEVHAWADWHVYYLYNPETGGFVSLVGYEDDELIAPSTLESWERSLGMEVPKPNNTN